MKPYPKTKRKLLRLLSKFEEAHEGWVNSGGGHPEDIPYLEATYLEYREQMKHALGIVSKYSPRKINK